MKYPRWSTPQRQQHLVSIFHRSGGFCVWQERMCEMDAHSYENFIEDLIGDWVRDDREADLYAWEVECRELHRDMLTRRFGRQFDPVARERYLEHQGSYYLERMGYDPLTFRRVAIVRVPSSDMRLLVNVSSAVKGLSKNKRRKMWRHGDTPLVEVARRIDYLCSQSVRTYLSR